MNLFLTSLIYIQGWSQQAEVFAPERQWTVGMNSETPLLSVMGIAFTEDGSLIVSDKLAHALTRIDREGHVALTRQKKGTEPGAFSGPGPVAVWNDVVAVADFASGRIQLLTLDFVPLREVQVSGSVFSLAFDDDGNLWVGALRALNGESLFKFDRDGGELFRRKAQAVAGSFFDAIFQLVCTGKKMRLVYGTHNTIEQWDTQGNPLGSITVAGFPPAAQAIPGGDQGSRETNVPPDILFVSCAADKSGRIALLAGDLGTHPRRDVFCINDKGEITALFTLPERSSMIRFDSDGRISAVENHKTAVSCYRLGRIR